MARPARAVANDLTADHNPFLDALIDNASHWQSTTLYLEPQHIGVYFSDSGSGGEWTPAEIASFQDALGRWASVANISFDMVESWRDANLIERKNSDTSVDAKLGQHEVPNDSDVAHGWFNSAPASFTAAGSLGRGGDAFYTFVHEIGHALGLTHTHDGRVFPGVDGRDATGAEVDIAFGDLGDHGLNQGVFSVMSYNATYNDFPGVGDADNFAWGRPMGPMAFDIAAIQRLYGANMNTATGHDTYVLPDVNDAGTGWSCIWDVSGDDQIVYDGMGNATIDLRAATLRNEEGGGGRLSHVDGIAGGFTIANGVWIENATGGSGADRITGNEHANQLDGRDGGDTIHGNGGGDTIHGGIGVDYLYGDAGVDTLHGDADGDVLYGGTEGDRLYGDAGADVLFGEAGVDRLYGGTEGDWLLGGADGDYLYGQAGADTLSGDAGVDRLYGGTEGDHLYGGTEGDWLYGEAGVDTLYGDAGIDNLDGGANNDTLHGGTEGDHLYGRGGQDTLWGEAGNDIFHFAGTADSPLGAGARDIIMDFVSGEDRIDLSNLDTAPAIAGNQDFRFVGMSTGSKHEAGDLWVTSGTDMVLVRGDVTGDGIADFEIEVRHVTALDALDFIGVRPDDWIF